MASENTSSKHESHEGVEINIRPVTTWRFCPYCAGALEHRHIFGRERLYCPQCGNVIFRDPKLAAGVLVEEQGKVLLVKRGYSPEKGKWGLPAGFMEWDEAPEETARRECLEETGLEVEIAELYDVYYYTDDFRGPGVVIIYRARIIGGRLQPGDDAVEARFFAPGELPSEIAFSSNKRALARWREEVQKK